MLRGTKENPLGTERVDAKVSDLINPVLGAVEADDLIARVNRLEALDDMRELQPRLTAQARNKAQTLEVSDRPRSNAQATARRPPGRKTPCCSHASR